MATCIVELFSLDEAASYGHAFNGIKVNFLCLACMNVALALATRHARLLVYSFCEFDSYTYYMLQMCIKMFLLFAFVDCLNRQHAWCDRSWQ